MTVKIISGWSAPGGSTVAHINLTNLLNENGIETIFYGPQDWHLDKCKSGSVHDLEFKPDDIAIVHFVNLAGIAQENVKKRFLYCHETNLYPLKEFPLDCLDAIVFVSNSQKAYHSVNHPSVIIPPVVEKIDWICPNTNIAGVIGSIDSHKQPHISIETALAQGYDKVLLFGDITEYPYYNEKVGPYINSGKAILMGTENDKQKMYNKVDKVFLSSKRETYGLARAECMLAKIPFQGTPASESGEPVENKEEILRRWMNLFNG